jgi:hypothetical protein
MGLLAYLKKNRIKTLKIIITLVVIYFILCIILQIASIIFENIYNTITLTYILILIICNFIVEFSPYFLNNYLIFIFPFLSHYSGRGAIYILIGFATISPELSYLLNIGGYALIILGLLCLYINWLIVKNFKLEYQDFEVMKDNYQDFNDEDQKDSLTFPKFTTNYDKSSGRSSINNNINNENKEYKNININKEINKNENINIFKIREDSNNNNNNEDEKNLEMKQL